MNSPPDKCLVVSDRLADTKTEACSHHVRIFISLLPVSSQSSRDDSVCLRTLVAWISETGEGNGLEGMEGLCFAKKGLRMSTRMFSHVCPAGLDKAGRMLFARLFEW